ncbi:uncharacterized protein LOC113385278 isoform X2 [Ctenocephalides felis]|uniref:uncharacterized protein LOC113385278 isoform X2 n=1 Tax=Ctenocephalides felis TaxID=7515 RepID=UPI000E6E5316|nr:uncharacterized protein LOC113385278 isoform X2 [Ctenocephalides felis]
MPSWAQRMHRRAVVLGIVMTACGHPWNGPYPHRLDKVKFGVALSEVFKNGIPAPLLVLILKLNKEAPTRKDVFRAPGHQASMKKLVHFMSTGRITNVDNYSVYTIASVLKKFLRKIPGGVFGTKGEARMFEIIKMQDEDEQCEAVHNLLASLPSHTQRLLVLLLGTFRVIATNAERADTGMSSEALGVSVAPSFFHTCVADGKTARMQDVDKYKMATRVMKLLIEHFTAGALFEREMYLYYARVTGRVLRVGDEWICSFRDPPPPKSATAQQLYARQLSLEAEQTWLQCECARWGRKYNLGGVTSQEESQSTPALTSDISGSGGGGGSSSGGGASASLDMIPEHSLLESCARLSVSLEGPAGLYGGGTASSSAQTGANVSSCSSSRSSRSSSHHMTLEELRAVNRYAESTKSLTYLPQVLCLL